ncbi:receptor activity-modifying protein 2 isoform X1 [Bufo gargarizans]|uniref:receptor activity-modifying protein 2 isoform X1 n=2 Tax=Bufo gargarizans TaxID=30331 RepID=UPI001CF53EAD|nr:receptor activity-modifying protein 2 isoform X1 [Bufo gargarizans]
MESTILCMLTSTLCLFTWAFSSMAAVENVTHPTNNVSNFNLTIANTPNSTVYPINVTLKYDRIVEMCWKEFNDSMFHINQEYWCSWEHIVSAYNLLQLCLEFYAELHFIAFPNELAHDAIVKAHMYHFKNCSLLSEELLDPPENILLGLIFAPICIIPFLVTLVVYKSNTSKAQT